MKLPDTLRHLFTVMLLLTTLVNVAPEARAAFSYTSSSALSTGRWVKIKVTTPGINQITDSELRAMGFSDPSKVSVFGYSATKLSDNLLKSGLPDDLPQVPALHTNGKLLFYAQTDITTKMVRELIYNDVVTYAKSQHNLYADYACYFLTDSRTTLQPATIAYSARTATPVTTSWGVMHYEKDVQIPGTMGAIALDRDFADEAEQTYDFEMPGYNGGKIVMQFNFGFAVKSSASLSVKLSDAVTLGPSALKTTGGENYYYRDNSFTYNVSNLPVSADGRYTASTSMATYLNANSVSSVGGLDYFTALYPRDNTMAGHTQQTFVFSSLAPTDNIRITTGNTTSLCVWDVSTPEMPRMFETATATDGVLVNSPGNYNIVQSTPCAYIVAFDPSATLPSVECMGEVAPQNIHAMAAPHMLIVASRTLMEQAQRLAELHREVDNIDVAVVSQEEVYNEFSSGARSPMAIRRVAKMFYDKAPYKFRSVLIFAPAHYDIKGFLQSDRQAFDDLYIPMFTCEDFAKAGHESHSFATDSYYGTLGENASSFRVLREQMTVNVGRIPAKNIYEAESYINKLENYLKNPPTTDFVNRAIIVADAGDSNSHLQDAEKLAATALAQNKTLTCYKTYNSIFPRKGTMATAASEHLLASLSKGATFWSYNGHSGPMNLSGNLIWNVDKVNANSYDVPPFVMFASCRTAYIDHTGSNLASSLLFKEDGGAIAVVGALREVYQTHNLTFSNFVTDEFFGSSAGATFGDVFRNGHNRAFTQAITLVSDQLAENTHCYNLVGDPEVKVPKGTCSATLTSVNGNSFSEETPIELAPGSTASIKGAVTLNGSVATGFTGELFLAIYDGARQLSVENTTDSSIPADVVTIDESLIYEKRLPVVNGIFEGELFIPTATNPGTGNRITFYAVNEDATQKATGGHFNLVVSDLTEPIETSDDNIPVITAMYLDSEEFTEGDVVPGNVTLHAEIGDNNLGVVGVSAVPGRAILVSLDNGAKTYSMAAGYFKLDANGGGVLDFPVTALTDGQHTLTLRVSNYAGQSAQRTISFTVHNDGADVQLTVDEYPASTQATINLTHNFSLEPTGRLVIKNGTGEIVHHNPAVTFPFTWNLTDNNGNPVAEGIYTAEAYLTDNTRFAQTKPVEIIVNRD